MEREILYEEVCTDGTIPEFVLAFRDSDWDEWNSDRHHSVPGRWVRNPRWIEQERQNAALEDSICGSNSLNYPPGSKILMMTVGQLGIDEGLALPLAHTAAEPPTFAPPKPQHRKFSQSSQYRTAFPDAPRGSLQHPRSQSFPPGAAHEASPAYPYRSDSENPDLAGAMTTSSPTPDGYARLVHAPASSDTKPPLSQEVIKLVIDIAKMKRVAGGMPSRLELRRVDEHFDAESGVLLASSLLRRHYGDIRLFPPKTWEYLVGGDGAWR